MVASVSALTGIGGPGAGARRCLIAPTAWLYLDSVQHVKRMRHVTPQITCVYLHPARTFSANSGVRTWTCDRGSQASQYLCDKSRRPRARICAAGISRSISLKPQGDECVRSQQPSAFVRQQH